MADSKYALAGATSNALPQLGTASETSALSGFNDPMAGLNLALTTASLDIRLMVAEQVKLREALTLLNVALSSQQSLLKANASAPAASSEPKSKLKAEIEQRAPLDSLKSSMAIETAMVELNQVLKLDNVQLQKLSESNLKLATEKQVAASGATAVQLAQVELSAAKAGIGAGLEPAQKQEALLNFTRDSAVTASAFGLDVKAASEMLMGWRTSMNLDRGQSQNLADATHYLGNSGLNAKAADIGSVVQSAGEAGITSGLTPEQVAALAAAFLNSGADRASTDAGLKSFTTGLAKGDAASPKQREAWAALDPRFEPKAIADGLRTDPLATINLVLEALKKKPEDQQQSLTKTLFGDNAAILELLKKPEGVQKAFLSVSERTADASAPKFEGSVAKTADALGNTSQGRWNAHDASQTRLSSAVGSALMPVSDGVTTSVDRVTDGLSSLAEGSPKAAAGIALVAAALGSLLVALGGAVMGEVLSRVGKKVLNQAAARLPDSVGDLISDVDDGGRKGKRGKPMKSRTPKARSPGQGRRLISDTAKTRPFLKNATAKAMPFLKGAVAKTKPFLKTATAKTLPFLKGAAATAMPMLSGATATAMPFLQSAMAKAMPFLQGATAKAMPFLQGATATAKPFLKVAPLLTLASAGYDYFKGSRNGDEKAVGGAVGELAGTVVGTAIGSFLLPGLGTAIGGYVGGMAGSWLGEKLASPADKLAAPDQVSKDLTHTNSQTTTQQNAMTANIYINGQDQASASQLANLVVQQITGQFGLLTTPNTLAMRSDAALTDGGT
ncbi:phage tail tape measure protein [Pseudomonas sp. N3-W]|uniref:phage tail tape measure protein n=1 Tax=Pseudomonas sp. N3-W TaxID=2975049 RepID=UPI00217F14A4|nr:phage tail tape measure protein [Pseudomonas sp. N3-W]UWF50533.1 phage tail tape measure protein [Pseudomonas sp. N3-W]